MGQIGTSLKGKFMSYMIKAPPRASKWAMISGTGDTLFNVNISDLTLKKFPLPNAFYSNTGFLCTISSSVITLASKRYVFFIKIFYDQRGGPNGLVAYPQGIWAFEFYLYVNNVQVSTCPIISSPGYNWKYEENAIALAEYVATAGDQLELRYQKKTVTQGTNEMGVYLHGGIVSFNTFGFYIMEVDL